MFQDDFSLYFLVYPIEHMAAMFSLGTLKRIMSIFTKVKF